MLFDTVSILLALAVLCCSLSAAMLLAWRLVLPGLPLLLWGCGMGGYGVGVFLITLRDSVPILVSTNVANLLIGGCYCLVWWGVSVYRNVRPHARTILVVLLLFIVIHVWFTFGDPDIACRAVISRSFCIFFLLGAVGSLCKGGLKTLTPMERGAAAALTLDVLFKALIVTAQLFNMSYKAPMWSNVFASSAAMLSLAGVTCWGLALIMMILEKTVADMRSAENASRTAQNQLETVIDNIPSLIYLKDRQGRLLACNQMLADLVGVSREQMLGKTSHDVFPAELADIQQTDDMSVLQSGKMLVTDEIVELGDGTHLFETTKLAVRDQAGEISAICGITSDVTERRRMETRLSESQQRLDTIANTSPALIWMAGLDKGCIWFNETWLAFTGRTLEQESGNGWAEGVHPEDFDRCLKIYIDSFEARESFAMEYRLRRHDGEYRWIYDQGQPRYDATGAFCGYIGSCLDVSDRVEALAKLHQKNAEIEQFIYTVSHDLRSPLVTVKSFLGYLEQDMETGDAEKVGQDLGFIHAAADKMEQLLNELLQMSRIGRQENPPTSVTFRELAQEAMVSVAGQVAGHNVNVQVADVELTLTGDRPRLAQIWQNLLDNAVKYMGDQPEPRVELGVERQDGEIVFFVLDNGIGVAPENRDRVFGMFDKLDRSTSGVGLGLAMVKMIVEQYTGRIWVESNGEGRGSCFRFTLPKALAA
ncbi:MAG: PAS domain-containing sensor histidine kinase [Desulfuromonadales bacterium]|nr:PAS domain-containing sensor histidine kinase [Desulfuromonadales bacterium]